METVRVNLVGIVNLSHAQLHAFQDDIKVLTDENYKRMKEEILADGFSFSPHVFQTSDDKWWLLDGHQRKNCLERMEKEGYSIPTIPCMEVEADDLEHARRLVLAAASQYGTFKVAKLVDFSKRLGIQPSELMGRYVLPTVKIEKFIEVSPHLRKITEGSTEVQPAGEFKHTCPKCSYGWN